ANPVVPTVQAVDLCAPGTATFTASAAPNSLITWYDSLSGGTPLDTGATFTTNVTGTTTFYATSTVGGGSASVGVVSPASLSGVSTADYDMYYMSFDMLGTGGTIKSVDIFPNVTPGASFTIQIQNSAGTVLFSQQGVTTVQGPTTPQTVPMGFYLPAGTGYRFK